MNSSRYNRWNVSTMDNSTYVKDSSSEITSMYRKWQKGRWKIRLVFDIYVLKTYKSQHKLEQLYELN